MARTRVIDPLNDPGNRVIQFAGNLKLTGDYRGRPFELLPFQEAWFRTIYGTLDHAGFRQYTKSSLFLPRKNGKSSLVSAAGVYHLFGEGIGKGGQEIYSAASNRDQSGRIYKLLKESIQQDPYLNAQVKFRDQTKTIVHKKLDNIFISLASDGGAVHGLNPSVVFADELHAWKVSKARDLFSALKTGSGTRREPLFIVLTTVGNDLQSLCHEEYQYAKQVASNPETDPEYLPVIFELPDTEDWRDESNWYKCNPALGKFVHIRELRKLYNEAKALPEREASFRQFQLNQWVQGNTKWLPQDRWNELQLDYTHADLEGRSCVGALDLAAVHDLASLCLVFDMEDGTYRVINVNWTAGETAKRREKADGVPYVAWSQSHPDALRLTPGETTNHETIEKDIIALSKRFKIKLLAIDPDNGVMISQRLTDQKLNVQSYYQSMAYMNAPSKQLERLILEKRIHHDGNPVLNWSVGNVKVERDAQDRIRPSKKRSNDRIDPVVALVMAIGVSMSEPETESVYKTRDVIFV
ncbi:MAG: Terminase [Planctomycetota bacterium]|nr:Terminase [Planctomycetota bacterium]